MTLTIKVTQADIDNATCSLPFLPMHLCCPIAQALRRQFPGKNVYVWLMGMGIGGLNFRAVDKDEELVRTITVLSRLQWPLCRPAAFHITTDS